MFDSKPVRSARYNDIIRESTLLFSEIGYERATVRMLAERLGIQAGSLYSHIQSKEEVLYWIVLDVAEEFFEYGRRAINPESTVVEQIRALSRSHMRVISSKRLEVQVYFQEWKKLGTEHRGKIVELRNEYESLLEGLLAEGNLSGELSCDPKFSSRLILSSLNSTLTWYSETGPMTSETIADSIIEIFLGGLARD